MNLKLRHIYKRFQDNILYEDLNMELYPGEVFALIGANGSGKTTLMKMILGLDREYEGEIERDGLTFGYSPESPRFPECLSGREVLEYYMAVRGTEKELRREEAIRLLLLVGLDPKDETRFENYSKGMTQRLGVAQALIGDPDVLLLDEPSAGLDFFGQISMEELIKSLKEKGKTILLNSHLLYDVEKVCDRGIILGGPSRRLNFNRRDLKSRSLAELFLSFAKEDHYGPVH